MEFTDHLKQIKQKRLEEDLNAFKQINDNGLFKFKQKMTLYNSYSTNFLIEPRDDVLVQKQLNMKKFRLTSWNKAIPLSSYLKKVKSMFSVDDYPTESIIEKKDNNVKITNVFDDLLGWKSNKNKLKKNEFLKRIDYKLL